MSEQPSPTARPALKRHFWTLLIIAILGAALLAYGSQRRVHSDSSATSVPPLTPQVVARFYGPMPTGVTVSHTGRVFVCFPRWEPHIPYTVAEVVGGVTRPYPNAAINAFKPAISAADHLLTVQSVVVDPKNRLWLLDAGDYLQGPAQPGAPKMVGIDLATNKVFKIIHFPTNVALSTTYLNDVRFDLSRGSGGYAYITDSALHGPRGIIVVDLGTGQSWRRLNLHPSTNPVPDFTPIVDNQPMLNRPKNSPPTHLSFGSDGIAISADGDTLYYCPLASRELYSVDLRAARNRKMSDADVKKTVRDLGMKVMSDGLESDAEGRIYCTDVEHHRIMIGKPGGPYRVLTVSPHATDWPDTMSLATSGYLYWMANQLDQQPGFHHGHDLRRLPYTLYRVKTDARPILLK